MKLIFFLDDNNGMMFFGKRQSRDEVATEYISELIGESRLLMRPYSEKLYGNLPNAETVDDFSAAGEDDFCLVEDIDPAEISGADFLIIFYWHRDYPADLFCTLDMKKFVECRRKMLKGRSHDRLEVIHYKLR